MADINTWYAIAVMSVITALLRLLPFIVFNGNRKTPEIIKKLSKLLPYAVMGMLVVYCFKGINFESTANYLPAIISAVLVGALHVWKRNTLLSIIVGTVCYMLLVQLVF